MPERGRYGRSAEPGSFSGAPGDLYRRLTSTLAALKRNSTLAALKRNRAAWNRHRSAQARHDMRDWRIERRQRTRHLIELGGLIVKACVVELTGDDRAMIYGALLWMADKLQSEHGERARRLWAAKGSQASPWNGREIHH